jgi:hypothetical protein
VRPVVSASMALLFAVTEPHNTSYPATCESGSRQCQRIKLPAAGGECEADEDVFHNGTGAFLVPECAESLSCFPNAGTAPRFWPLVAMLRAHTITAAAQK